MAVTRHTTVPLLLSISIYVLFRSKVFIAIDPDRLSTLHAFVSGLQSTFKPVKAYLPDWFLYSLPDGLWTYAFTAYLVLNSRNDPAGLRKSFLLFFTPVFSVSIEVSQYLKLFPGTFDWVDLGFDIAGAVLPLLLFYPPPILARVTDKYRSRLAV